MKRLKLGNCRHGQDVQFHRHSWAFVAAGVISVGTSILSKPKAPGAVNYTPVSVGDSQKQAVASNLSNSSSIEALIARGNSFNTDQALSIQNQTMPGYSSLAKSLTSRAQGLADNPYDVPKEVEDNLARLAAERGISAGTRGQFNDFSLLRDFGVNQLQYGESNLNQARGITDLLSRIAPKVNPMSPMSFYVSPQQVIDVTTNNNTQAQAIAQGANNANTSADNAFRKDLWGSLNKLAGSYFGAGGGG